MYGWYSAFGWLKKNFLWVYEVLKIKMFMSIQKSRECKKRVGINFYQ